MEISQLRLTVQCQPYYQQLTISFLDQLLAMINQIFSIARYTIPVDRVETVFAAYDIIVLNFSRYISK